MSPRIRDGSQQSAEIAQGVPEPLAPSELSKEPRINRNVLDLPHAAVHTKLVLLQQVAELIAVDQIDGRRPVTGRLALGFGGVGACCDQQALVAAPAHRSAEV